MPIPEDIHVYTCTLLTYIGMSACIYTYLFIHVHMYVGRHAWICVYACLHVNGTNEKKCYICNSVYENIWGFYVNVYVRTHYNKQFD